MLVLVIFDFLVFILLFHCFIFSRPLLIAAFTKAVLKVQIRCFANRTFPIQRYICLRIQYILDLDRSLLNRGLETILLFPSIHCVSMVGDEASQSWYNHTIVIQQQQFYVFCQSNHVTKILSFFQISAK